MPRLIKVRPADPSTLVRIPDRQMVPMPVEGAEVELDDYWHARLRDGTVVEVPSIEPPAPAPKKK